MVRRVLRGQTGPSGGPAFTDVLGVLQSFADGVAVVQPEQGPAVSIATADIVSGKPVPPRASARLRVSAADAERRALAAWPAVHTEQLGEWVLRAASGFSTRANSVLAVGSPQLPVAEAARRVQDFYAARELTPLAQVVVGSDEERSLTGLGWTTARPGEDDTLFQIASTSAARRSVRRLLPDVVPEAEVAARATGAWLADDERARAFPDAALAVLQGPADVGFVSVPGPTGEVIAKGRVARGAGHVPGDQDWVGISDVWVSPARRRQGLATVVLAAMLDWAAERGATTAFLQVRGDNTAAVAAYERLGFVTHHAYRYLRPA